MWKCDEVGRNLEMGIARAGQVMGGRGERVEKLAQGCARAGQVMGGGENIDTERE